MKCLSTVTLSLGIIALVGCSKALTESSASVMMQKWVDSQTTGGIVSTFAGSLTNQIGVALPQRWTSAGVQRVIKEGYLQEKATPITYPNVTGEFEGPSFKASLGSQGVLHFSLKCDVSHPPNISGSFFVNQTFNNFAGGTRTIDTGTLTGSMNRSGVYRIAFSPTQDISSNRPPSATMSLVRGNPDALTGKFERMNIDFGVVGDLPYRLQGKATQPDIVQDEYLYTWTDKLPKDVFNGPTLKLGHLVVDSCDHLLLASDTAATASCKTHVKLTSAAEVIFGNRPTDQLMQASFGKQPDGSWVGTNLNGAPPQYNIFQ